MTTKFSRIPAMMLPAKGATICDGLSDTNCHLGQENVQKSGTVTLKLPRRWQFVSERPSQIVAPLAGNIIAGIRENFVVIDDPIVTGVITVDIAPRSGRESCS